MATITVKFANELTTDAGTKVKIFETTSPRDKFVQNETCTKAGIGIQPYGVAMIPDPLFNTNISWILEAVHAGTHYYAAASAVALVTVGNNLTMSDSVPE